MVKKGEESGDSIIKQSSQININKRKSLVVHALNERAKIFQLLGDYEKSLKDYQRMVKILPSEKTRLHFYMGLSDLYFETGKIKDAHNSIQKAIYLARKNNMVSELIKSLLSFSHILRKMGFYKKALKVLAEAKYLLRKHPELSKEIEIEVLNVAEGIIYCLLGKYYQGLMFFRKALRIARNKNNLRRVSFILTDIGNAYSEMGILNKALNYYNQGLKITEKIQDKPMMIDSLYSIASILSRQHNYKKAIEFINEAIEISKNIKSLDGMYYNLFAKGMLLTNLGKFNEAIKAHKQSLKIFRITKDPLVMIENLLNIGKIYLMKGWYKKCINFFDRAETLARKIQNPFSISEVLNNKVKYFIEIGDPEKAFQYLKESYKLTKKYNILIQHIECLTQFAKLIIRYDKVDSYTITDAHKFINQAFSLTKNSKEYEVRILPIYIEYYLKIKDYKKASKYAIEYLRMVKKLGLINQLPEAYLFLIEIKSYRGEDYLKDLGEAKKVAMILGLKPIITKVKNWEN